MITEYIRLDRDDPDPEAIRRAGAVIRSGGLVAFPTETVYGLGGGALQAESSRRIYAAKGRPSDNPLIVHICSMEDLPAIVEDVPSFVPALAGAFWPGPLTMIMKKSELIPSETTGGLDTVAVRFPSHKTAMALIREAGGYVAAPSANRSGRPSTTTGEHCLEDLDGRIEMILDAGPVGIGLESTIVDLTRDVPEILRPGAVTEQMLREVIGNVSVDRTIYGEDDGRAPRAPGMKYRHYAPEGELLIVEGGHSEVRRYIRDALERDRAAGKKTGVICAEEHREDYPADSVKSAGSAEDETAVARSLFRFLRDFDREGVERIYSEAFSQDGIGQAVMNRLMKAAGHRIVKL